MNKLSSFDFSFPKELIAQYPLKERDKVKLLVLNKDTGVIEHLLFQDIVKFFSKDDCLVINVSKVFPARIFGKKETGGKVEILFLNPVRGEVKIDFVSNGVKKNNDEIWEVLIKGSPNHIYLPDGTKGEIIGKTESGSFLIKFCCNNILETIYKYGEIPLPPYIKRKPEEVDKEMYQTIYARVEGSVAAPTAGLHFTQKLLQKIREEIGVNILEVVLHINWATFKKIENEDISKHKMLPEYFFVPQETIEKINLAKINKKRIFATGTSTVRALETAALLGQESGKTELFIWPGYRFKVVDCLITNFHLPKSSPLILVCAFAGKEKIFSAYREAIRHKYRLFSYGDAMLII